MRLTDDLSSSRAILWKGWLFLALGLLSGAILLFEVPQLQIAVLFTISVWAFCRWYYFMFYVIENYVDPNFKFTSISSALRYLWAARRGVRGG